VFKAPASAYESEGRVFKSPTARVRGGVSEVRASPGDGTVGATDRNVLLGGLAEDVS